MSVSSVSLPGAIPRRDARVVLLSALALTLAAVLAPPGKGLRLAGLAVIVSVLLARARVSPRWLLQRLALLLPFALLLVLSAPFMGGGDRGPALPRLGMAAARTLVAFAALAWVASAASPAEIAAALGRLRLPRLLVTLFAFLIRYLGVLEDEARRMLRARDLRGTPRSLAARAAVAGHMVGSLFIRSFERAERVGAAMASRGFTGRLPAAAPSPLAVGDWALLGGVLLAVAGLALFTRGGG